MERRLAAGLAVLALVGGPGATGCVTVAEYRKLERDVIDLQRGGGADGVAGERLAELSAQVESLEQQIARLEGRLEVAEHNVEAAMREARAARAEAASAASRASESGPATASETGSGGTPQESAGGAEVSTEVASDEVRAYRAAYAAWRGGNPDVCIDQFRKFLQTYPNSAYADDAAYWMADCYYKQGDQEKAILRFAKVVEMYPTGNKAPDALYRQGEVLLNLGPSYSNAARDVFQRVLTEYPDSPRADEAQRQLERLSAG